MEQNGKTILKSKNALLNNTIRANPFINHQVFHLRWNKMEFLGFLKKILALLNNTIRGNPSINH